MAVTEPVTVDRRVEQGRRNRVVQTAPDASPFLKELQQLLEQGGRTGADQRHRQRQKDSQSQRQLLEGEKKSQGFAICVRLRLPLLSHSCSLQNRVCGTRN